MRPITLVLLMLSSAAALAQSATDAEPPPRRAQALISAVRDEQRAVYQPFQRNQALQQA